jgi:hypothetical protein
VKLKMENRSEYFYVQGEGLLVLVKSIESRFAHWQEFNNLSLEDEF